MTAGLPGSGIGGVFYLLSALWMPFHQLLRHARGHRGPVPLRLIARQTVIAAAMIAVLFATGHGIGWLLEWQTVLPAVATEAGAAAAAPPQVLRTALLLITAAVLASLLLGVELASLLLRRRVVPLPAAAAAAAAEPEPEQHAA